MAKAPQKTLEEIIRDRIPKELRALFSFDLARDSDEVILFKFGIWARYFFPKPFKQEEADFHTEMDANNLHIYRGSKKSYTNICFRGAAKTTRTRLFLVFVILNDKNHYRRYFKVLCKDFTNSKQIVTDIYNMLVNKRIQVVYPGTFAKTEEKREETMHAFTTATNIKMLAGTVGTEQRGHLQGEDASRPDFVWFDDFETRMSLHSAAETQKIWENMDEARTGLSPAPNEGGCIYTCNYISERGNVHRLVLKANERNIVQIVPIRDKKGNPTWYHTPGQIEQIEEDAEDFAGDYLCEPSAGGDVMFDRDVIDAMTTREPIKVLNEDYHQFYRYQPGHRYATGADVAGGVGLDSSASVTIDFDTVPARVVATYTSDDVKPDMFGYELKKHGDRYGECIVAPEINNHGHATIAILKLIYTNIFYTDEKDDVDILKSSRKKTRKYGWHTTAASKPKMLFSLIHAVDNGLLELTDERLRIEARAYARDDLMDKEDDPRLTTRHFDLLIAAAIAWQMKDYATYQAVQTEEELEELTSAEEVFDRYAVI